MGLYKVIVANKSSPIRFPFQIKLTVLHVSEKSYIFDEVNIEASFQSPT